MTLPHWDVLFQWIRTTFSVAESAQIQRGGLSSIEIQHLSGRRLNSSRLALEVALQIARRVSAVHAREGRARGAPTQPVLQMPLKNYPRQFIYSITSRYMYIYVYVYIYIYIYIYIFVRAEFKSSKQFTTSARISYYLPVDCLCE